MATATKTPAKAKAKTTVKAPVKTAEKKPARQTQFEKTGKGSATLPFVEMLVARRKASGKLDAGQLKTYRETLMKRHGLKA